MNATLSKRAGRRCSRGRLLLAVPLAVLAVAAPAQANDYYVTQGGLGSACTSAQPCAAIPTAVSDASDGDTIHVGPGTYTSPIDTAKRLTFIGAGAGSATSTNPATDTFVEIPGDGTTVAMILRGGGRVSGMRIRGQDKSGTYTAGGTGLRLIPGPGPDGLTYEVDRVVSIGGQGIVDGSGVEVRGIDAPSRVFSVAIDSSALRSDYHGLHVDASNANVTLQDSDLHGVLAAQAVATARAERVHGDASATISRGNLVIERSRFDSTHGALYVIGYGGPARATVRDSIFTGASGNPYQPNRAVAYVRGGESAGEDSLLTSHGSTFYATGPAWHAAVLGFRVPGRLGNVGMQLVNTVVRREGADGTTTADLVASTDNGDTGGAVTIDASHSAYSSALVTGLSTAPAPGAGTNIAGDPLFVATPAATLPGTDLSLQPGSPLIDRADPTQVTAGERDFAGALRSLDGNGDCSATPDIGAYERAALACPQPVITPALVTPANTADTVRPVLSQLRIARSKASFTLSEPARVTLVIERARRGRRIDGRCVAKRRSGARCSRWLRVRKLSLPAASAGANAVALGKISRGRHRIRATAVDAAGNRSAAVTASFDRRR